MIHIDSNAPRVCNENSFGAACAYFESGEDWTEMFKDVNQSIPVAILTSWLRGAEDFMQDYEGEEACPKCLLIMLEEYNFTLQYVKDKKA